MNKSLIFILITLFITVNLSAQLVVNEVSQGTGSDEYAELVVVGTRTCVDSTVNLQGWIIDDNCGFYGSAGIAQGHYRFSTDPQWAAVPFGTIIVVYNEDAVYPGIVADETDANNDNVYFLPSTSSYFETNENTPGGGTAITTYTTTGYIANGDDWVRLGMRNGGDVFHTVSPSVLNASYHSVGWGNMSGMDIAFVGSASGFAFQNENITDNDPYLQSNWASQNQATGSPGQGNSVANTAWINAMLNSMTGAGTTINETICDGDSLFFDGEYLHALGTYTDTVPSASGCDSIVTLNLNVEICTACEIDLGNDTLICGPVNMILDAGNFDEYLWQDGSTNQTYNATTTGQFYCEAFDYDATNLIVNPGFESGNINFNSEYDYSSSGSQVTCPSGNQSWGIIGCEGTYSITTSPSLVHNNFPSCADHTTGTGNMLITNGSGTPNTSAWCQTIAVDQNTDYYFSIWVMSPELADASNVAQLQFQANGTQLGSIFTAPFSSCVWQNYTETWNSGTATSITLCIQNQNTVDGGNDFAIDDIFFGEVCIARDTINITNTPVNPIIDTIAVCFNDSALLYGEYETVSGVYFDTLVGASGCDSIYYQTEFIIGDSLYSNEDAFICFTDSIFLENAWQNTSNLYVDTVQTANACDSLVFTNLTVSAAPTSDTTTICSMNLLDVGTVILDTIPNYFACDSVYNYQTTIFSAIDSSFNVGCTDNPALAIARIDTSRTALLCDSFYAFTTVTYVAPIDVVIIDSCTNIAANAYSFIDTISTSMGCDSVFEYNEVRYIQRDTVPLINLCTNDLSQATINYVHTPSIHGCDSFTTVQQVVYVPLDTQTLSPIEICIGASENIFGVNQNESGVYKNEISSVGGCDSLTVFQELIVNPLPAVYAGMDTTIEIEESVVLEATGAETYAWNTGETNSVLNITPEETYTYVVLGTDSNTCSAYDSVLVIVLIPEINIFIPTGFSPNGDGVNDFFKIINEDDFEDISISVFNRWGEQIFISDINYKYWDGTYKAVDQPIASYIYNISATAKKSKQEFNVSGNITLIR